MTLSSATRFTARCDGTITTACHTHQCPDRLDGATLLDIATELTAHHWTYTPGIFQPDGNDRHHCPAHRDQARRPRQCTCTPDSPPHTPGRSPCIYR